MTVPLAGRLENLKTRYFEGEVDRRTFLGLTAAAAGALGISACWMPRALAAVTEVRFDGWGGVVQAAIDKYALRPYSAKTGINVVEGTFDEEQGVVSIAASSPGRYQVVHSSGLDYYKRYIDAGVASQLNEVNIPNLANVMTAIIDPFRRVSAKLSCVPYDYGTSGIAYNRDFISDEEAQMKGSLLLLDAKFAGRISGYDDMQTRMWYAALQTNQDPNNIQDLSQIWAKVSEGLKLTRGYWRSGVELMELLAKREVVVTDAWSGRVADLQQQGHPIGYYDPVGSKAWAEHMLVMKGSPMPECEELCNFMLDSGAAIAVAQIQKYPPSIDPKKVRLPEAITNLPGFDKTGELKSLTFADPGYWATNFAVWQRQWHRLKAS